MDMEGDRTARVEARIAPEALAVIRRAAEMQGRGVNDFVVSAAYDTAKRAIEEASSSASRSRISAPSRRRCSIRRRPAKDYPKRRETIAG